MLYIKGKANNTDMLMIMHFALTFAEPLTSQSTSDSSIDLPAIVV